MGEETPETETEKEEIEEYTLVEEPEQHEIIEKDIEEKEKKPEKTKITRTKKVKGLDYCPFCNSERIGKDYKKNIYICFDCGGTYRVAES